MSWTQRSSASSRRDGLSSELRGIAEQCSDAVWSRLPTPVVRMDTAELRGYARALAMAAVRERLVAEDTLSFATTCVLIDRTVNIVLQRQLLDLQVPRARRSAA